jgi:chorismate synthase
MPIVIRTAVRPTASIGREQMSVDVVKGAETQLKVTGRHDPCIVPRAIPVIEAVCAYKLLDHLITSGQLKRKGISI